MVLKELQLLAEDANVFKQMGPALVRQDHVEAVSNVSKRLEFIGSEVQRIDDKLASLEEKARKKQVLLEKLQVEAARLSNAAAAAAAASSGGS